MGDTVRSTDSSASEDQNRRIAREVREGREMFDYKSRDRTVSPMRQTDRQADRLLDRQHSSPVELRRNRNKEKLRTPSPQKQPRRTPSPQKQSSRVSTSVDSRSSSNRRNSAPPPPQVTPATASDQ